MISTKVNIGTQYLLNLVSSVIMNFMSNREVFTRRAITTGTSFSKNGWIVTRHIKRRRLPERKKIKHCYLYLFFGFLRNLFKIFTWSNGCRSLKHAVSSNIWFGRNYHQYAPFRRYHWVRLLNQNFQWSHNLPSTWRIWSKQHSWSDRHSWYY